MIVYIKNVTSESQNLIDVNLVNSFQDVLIKDYVLIKRVSELISCIDPYGETIITFSQKKLYRNELSKLEKTYIKDKNVLLFFEKLLELIGNLLPHEFIVISGD